MSTPAARIVHIYSDKPKRFHRRRFERGTPEGALSWNSAKQRSKLLYAWQCAVLAKFKARGHALAVAWQIFTLCQQKGYAYPTDSYIGGVTGIQINHVQATLTALEKAGAIVRASVFVDGKPHRRIWPGTKIIPPKSGGIDTPKIRGVHDTPKIRGTDSKGNYQTSKRDRKTGISSTADAARREAERRAQRCSGSGEAKGNAWAEPGSESGAQPLAPEARGGSDGRPTHTNC
jgi:hypothetical protein